MDDIVKVLVIMAAFALPLIRQIKKSKTERSAQKPFVPIPDTEEPEVLKVTRKYQPLHSQPTSQKVEVKKKQPLLTKKPTRLRPTTRNLPFIRLKKPEKPLSGPKF